jgi:hypothetical protein
MGELGLIWSEGGKTEEVLRRAVRRYVERFGKMPGKVLVNQARVKGEVVIDGVRVEGVRDILVNDYFVTG